MVAIFSPWQAEVARFLRYAFSYGKNFDSR